MISPTCALAALRCQSSNSMDCIAVHFSDSGSSHILPIASIQTELRSLAKRYNLVILDVSNFLRHVHLADWLPVINISTELLYQFNGTDSLPKDFNASEVFCWFGQPRWGSLLHSEKTLQKMPWQALSPTERSVLEQAAKRLAKQTMWLYEQISPEIVTSEALHRGLIVQYYHRIERTGVPLNINRLNYLNANWDLWFDHQCKHDGLSEYFIDHQLNTRTVLNLIEQDYPHWTVDTRGRYSLTAETFKEMAASHPELIPLARVVRHSVRKPNLLFIDSDGRHRFDFRPLSAKTGRCRPMGNNILNQSRQCRQALLSSERYIVASDYKQQEFAIAAALSGDQGMLTAYSSEQDTYLEFARHAGEVITPVTQARIRPRYKEAALAVMYGMGELSLAEKIHSTPEDAKILLERHRKLFPKFWQWQMEWSEQAISARQAVSGQYWRMSVNRDTPQPRLRNWPMQATGAQMTDLAMMLAVDAGVEVTATHHDAIYAVAHSLPEARDVEETLQDCMQQAALSTIGIPYMGVSSQLLHSPQNESYSLQTLSEWLS